ncbi:hypothetical protein Trydic_g16437 [Trypoxylus dichotomus]
MQLRYNLLLHEEQEGQREQAVQPKEHTIVERQERSSRHTVQLNHEAESSKDATLQDFAFNSTAQMKTSSVILGTANVDISNEEEGCQQTVKLFSTEEDIYSEALISVKGVAPQSNVLNPVPF